MVAKTNSKAKQNYQEALFALKALSLLWLDSKKVGQESFRTFCCSLYKFLKKIRIPDNQLSETQLRDLNQTKYFLSLKLTPQINLQYGKHSQTPIFTFPSVTNWSLSWQCRKAQLLIFLISSCQTSMFVRLHVASRPSVCHRV